MQSICLLLAGRRGLENSDDRQSILRIPEVSQKIKEAQGLLDQTLDPSARVDLYSFLQSPENEFNGNTGLKSLASAVVQVGLYERFIKYRNQPQFMIGRVNGSSALKVCSGQQSFADLITTSRYCMENSIIARFTQNEKSRLTGSELEEFGAIQWNPNAQSYEERSFEKQTAGAILSEISAHHLITQCIHVGPSSKSIENELEECGLYTISSISSIDLDPILSSFWKAS